MHRNCTAARRRENTINSLTPNTKEQVAFEVCKQKVDEAGKEPPENHKDFSCWEIFLRTIFLRQKEFF